MKLTGFFDYPSEEGEASDPLADLPDDPVLGADWTDERWDILMSFTERVRLRPGERLIRAGERERVLFIIESGLVEVVLPGRRGTRFPTGPGSVLGEVAFFDGSPRTADVVAVEQTDVRRLSERSVEILSARHPDVARDLLLGLGKLLAFRLRRAEALARA